jgi:hypothetical protein
LFIDRDPDLFEYVITYLRNNKTTHLPVTEKQKMRQLRVEAKYFNITGLMDFFDPLRYPVEIIGEENIKMRQVRLTFYIKLIINRMKHFSANYSQQIEPIHYLMILI